MAVREKEIREARRFEERERVLVCDGHGVACFKPEKKAKWKHVNACSFVGEGNCLFLVCFSSPRVSV